MANTKISALPAASALGGSEILPAVQTGADVGATALQLQAFALAALQPAYISSNYYLPPFVSLGAGTALTANSIGLMPFVLPAAMTVKALGAYISTAASGGNIQCAVYANSAGRPSGPALISTRCITVAQP